MSHITLSEGEWKIMKLLWQKSPRTIAEFVSELEAETGWTKATVFVMLTRLIAKDAVRLDDTGRLHQYYPRIARKDIAPEETDSFLSRVYDGSISMMVSALAGRKPLPQEEIRELRRILDEAEHGKE